MKAARPGLTSSGPGSSPRGHPCSPMLPPAGSRSTTEVGARPVQGRAVLAAVKGAERRCAVACGHP